MLFYSLVGAARLVGSMNPLGAKKMGEKEKNRDTVMTRRKRRRTNKKKKRKREKKGKGKTTKKKCFQ